MTTPTNKNHAQSTKDAFASHDLPTGKSEDVEYSEELADAEDLAAQARAEAADARAEQ